MAGTAVAVGRALGVDVERLGLRLLARFEPDPTAAARPLPGPAEPDVLGRVHESLLDADHRHAEGAHYTLPAVADGIVAEALTGARLPARPRVADPAVGGGAFLLATARALHRRGIPPATIVNDLLWGADIDDVAVAVTEASLVLWAAGEGVAASPGDHLVVGDFLDPACLAGPFDLVVGNPPFQGQLARATRRSPEERARLRAWLGPAAHGYADSAALFAVAAARRLREGGRAALVQPVSVLAADHAAPARRALLDDAALVGLWVADQSIFADASVSVCVPVLEAGGPRRRSVRCTTGAAVGLIRETEVDSDRLREAPSWSILVGALDGVPPVELDERAGTVADLATATAGFRDQYYGLVPAVSEGGPGAPLVTAGLLDPLCWRWGTIDTRFAGRRWRRPTVDLDEVAARDPRLARWLDARLTPKLVVASQTRTVELAVDDDGGWVPSVPVVAVHADADRLWPLAAALSAPPVSAWLRSRAWGSGLSPAVMRLSAGRVTSVPLPVDRTRWDEAAHRAQEVAAAEPATRPDRLAAFAAAATAAYGLPPDHPVVGWWLDSLPAGR